MTETPLEYFGKSASGSGNFAEIAGRYSFQRQAEQYLLYDLLEKLSLSPHDDVLEIGCGAGNVLIPLSFFVHSITGVDHQDLLVQIKSRAPKDNSTITLIPGNFLTADIPGTFSCILIYSVIHYLRDEEEVLSFIRKAASQLRPRGKMLIGDIPNKDIKARFLATEQGKIFEAEWKEKVEATRGSGHHGHSLMTDVPLVAIDDALIEKILEMLEELHMRVRRVAQPKTLSFCFTREDIIVENNQ